MEPLILEIQRTGVFKKDQKRISKRGYTEAKLTHVVLMLAQGTLLPARFRNHKLRGNYEGHWECHIEPDWLLVHRFHNNVLQLVRTGTHADLFEK